jgi:hypothetical protein
MEKSDNPIEIANETAKPEKVKEKVKGKFKIISAIFFTGLVAGIFSGFATNTGYSLSLDSILIKSTLGFCDFMKGLLSDTSSSECGVNFKWLSIILGVLGGIEILITAARLKNWILGLIVFGIGYGVGFFIALFV